MTTKPENPPRYCPLCGCKKPRGKGWLAMRVLGIRTWVCPEHKDKV